MTAAIGLEHQWQTKKGDCTTALRSGGWFPEHDMTHQIRDDGQSTFRHKQ